MISSLKPSDQQFLANVDRIHDRLNKAQKEISTGLRVSQVSDDPGQIAALLSAHQHLESAKQLQANLGRTKGEVDGAEQAVRHAVELFERARTLGAEGANATQSAATRAGIAQEVGSILEQLVGLSATTIEGRHIFSGDTDQAAPYTIDLSQANPVSAYLGSAATREAQHPNGSTFAVAHTAQQIFDSTDPTTNVFATLNTLRQALLANDIPATLGAIDALTPAEAYLNSQLAFYGTTQNKVAEATDFGQSLQTSLQAQISTISEADLSQSILELNQAQTELQASLQSFSRLPRTSLFDYLG